MKAETLKDGEALPFAFDVNFAAPKPVEPEPVPEEELIPTISVPEHESLMAVAKDEGYKAGLKAARESEEKRLADEAARVANAAEQILAAIDEDRELLEAECGDLALAIARRLADEAIQQFPVAEIEKLIGDCLGSLRKTPHLVVRLNENDASRITETVGKLARERGFEGRFVVLGEPDFAVGDCRIEWADGGIVRDRAIAEAEIIKVFQSYFVAINDTSASEKDDNEPSSQDDSDNPASTGDLDE